MKFFARNQIRNSVSQETKLKTVKHQKNNRLFRRNNRLFILVKITATEFEEFKEERGAQTVYTSSLLNQELHPVSQKPLGNPLSNQNQITYPHHQRSDLDPLKKHTSFGSAHIPRMLILTTSRAHNPSWLYNTRMFKGIQNELHFLQNELKSIQNVILFHSLLINQISKVKTQIFESTL